MKTVLVTGSSRGIGYSTIIEFAKNNYNVVINYVNHKEEATKLKEYVEKKYNVNALVVKCDINNEIGVTNMINKVLNKFDNIDVLINNASIALDNDILDKTKEEFMKVLETNVIGTFLVTKEVINKCNPKTIINVSSTDSIDTYNTLNIDYSVSKSGINMLTKTFALRFPTIKVCAIAPNFVNTDSVKEMNPSYLKEELKRINQKELLEPSYLSKKIYEIVIDDSIKSGVVKRIDWNSEEYV